MLVYLLIWNKLNIAKLKLLFDCAKSPPGLDIGPGGVFWGSTFSLQGMFECGMGTSCGVWSLKLEFDCGGLDDDDVLQQETLPEPPTDVVLPELGWGAQRWQ